LCKKTRHARRGNQRQRNSSPKCRSSTSSCSCIPPATRRASACSTITSTT
jgi:hypothetical protein